MRRQTIDLNKLISKIGTGIQQRKTSEFYELIPRANIENGNDIKNQATSRRVKELIARFYETISFQFPDNIPFSILPCILGLPEKLSDWPSPEQLREMLIILLADHGVLFDEARPISTGQYAPQDLAAALDKENHALDLLIGEDTLLISETLKRFWDVYRLPNEASDRPPSVLKKLEEIASPQEPDWFRRCILQLLSLSHQTNSAQMSSSDFIVLCRKKWGLSKHQLEHTVPFNNKHDGPHAVSLENALNTLFSIWNELFGKYIYELTSIQRCSYVSNRAYASYQSMCQTMPEIEKNLDSTPLQICNSNKLPNLLKENVWFWAWCSERIPAELSLKFLVKLILVEDEKLHPNRFLKYLKCSSFQDGPTQVNITAIELNAYTMVQERLETQYIEYWERRRGKTIKRSEALHMSMEFIFKISVMEQFCIHDEDLEDVSALPITLAPVISTLVFYHYGFCTERALTQINTNILFEATPLPRDPKETKAIPELFVNLCCIYAEFYGSRYNADIQAEWDAAFLVYFGYQTLYQKGPVWTDEHPTSFLFHRINDCLISNEVGLAHSWLLRKKGSLDDFRARIEEEPKQEIYRFFRSILIRNYREQAASWLTQFQEFLRYPYSFGAIRDFMEKLLVTILDSIKHEKGSKYQICKIESKLKCLLPHVKDPATRMCAALEYTMRRILTERCRKRLYNWLSAYLDYQIDQFNSREDLLG